MTPAEIAKVLTKCSAYDLRTVGKADVAAWAEILGYVELCDAMDAVTRFYAESSVRAMPADILRHSKAAKRDRLRRDGHRADVLGLPSRFETDEQRNARIAARAADARAQIRKPRRNAAPVGPSAMEQLRAMTAGPQWPDPELTS